MFSVLCFPGRLVRFILIDSSLTTKQMLTLRLVCAARVVAVIRKILFHFIPI